MGEISVVSRKLVEISRMLVEADIEHIKLIYEDELGGGVLENASKTKLMKELKTYFNYGKDMESTKRFWIELLDAIGRNDIISSVFNQDVPKETLDAKQVLSMKKTGSKIPIEVFERIADMIPRDWKRVARKLDYDENGIDQIDLDQRTTYEKGFQMLTRWSKDCKEPVTWELLKGKLEKVPRYDIIRDVEEKFPQLIEEKSPPAPATAATPNTEANRNMRNGIIMTQATDNFSCALALPGVDPTGSTESEGHEEAGKKSNKLSGDDDENTAQVTKQFEQTTI